MRFSGTSGGGVRDRCRASPTFDSPDGRMGWEGRRRQAGGMTAHSPLASSDPTAAPASSLPSATPPAGPGTTSPVAIRLRGLTRVYEVPGRQDARVTALDHVDADLPEGSFTAVVGASGSGKSTLLHCMAGLDEPTSGQVTMLGALTSGMRAAERARFRARHVGFVFQEYNLIASLSAADNVSMPSRLAGRPLNGAQTREALDAVGLAHRAGLKPHQLSGGERQRVAIARVMASRPRIVFADEPTGALDLDSAALVLDWLRRLTEQGTTVVMVTHDVEAAARADAVAVMSQGHLVQWTDCRDARQIAELVHSARAARAA